MRERLTANDLDDSYVKMTAALAAEAMAGKITKEQAVAAGQRLQREWRTDRWDAVQRGLTETIEEFRATGDPAAAGTIRILETFRDDPETPMLRDTATAAGGWSSGKLLIHQRTAPRWWSGDVSLAKRCTT